MRYVFDPLQLVKGPRRGFERVRVIPGDCRLFVEMMREETGSKHLLRAEASCKSIQTKVVRPVRTIFSISLVTFVRASSMNGMWAATAAIERRGISLSVGLSSEGLESSGCSFSLLGGPSSNNTVGE